MIAEYPKSTILLWIIAVSEVVLEIPPDRYQYEGRSHSLWYCIAQEGGVYRWYEVAFMHRPSMGRRGRKDPFSLAPSDRGITALAAIIGVLQAAWPFTPIDQGNEDEFIERWIGWLADDAEGRLSYPSRMPERDPKDSWRLRQFRFLLMVSEK